MITIRPLTADDVKDFRAIRLTALRSDPDAFGSTWAVESDRPLSHFAGGLASSTVFAAYADTRIVGMAGFAPKMGPREGHQGILWGVFLAAEARGQGVGRALIQAVIDHATPRVEQLTLIATGGNDAAIRLYETLGFTTYGVLPKALKGPDGYKDEILMVRTSRP